MKKEAFEQLKNELLMLAVIFVLAFISFKIVFWPEEFLVVLRTVFAIFWLLVLPGFAAMLYWKEELKFYERLIIGIGIGTILLGILSYYSGLWIFPIKYHIYVLPTLIIAVGMAVGLRK